MAVVGDQKSGWVNIDIAGGDIRYDLKLGMPPSISKDSVDFIYSSHFLEHVYDDEALEILKNCLNVLKPGKKIRLCLPDLKKLAKAYIEKDQDFFSLLPSGNKDYLISYLEYCAYQYADKNNDHKALYDIEKITNFLKLAGFTNVNEVQFNSEIDVNSEERIRYSFYVEAKKKIEHATFVDGSSALFALTVTNRIKELRSQQALIRNVYGNSINIQLFCNCPKENIDLYSGFLEDGFNWCENKGHSEGAMDHVNMIVEFCDDFDYIIAMATKTLWTDYSLLKKIISEMKVAGKKIAVFQDNEIGHFGNKSDYAFFCDLLIMESQFYKKVFPIPYENDNFPEKQITKKVLSLITKDEIYYIPCKPPNDTVGNDFVFQNILNTNNEVISIRDFNNKLKRMREKNLSYALVIDKLLNPQILDENE